MARASTTRRRGSPRISGIALEGPFFEKDVTRTLYENAHQLVERMAEVGQAEARMRAYAAPAQIQQLLEEGKLTAAHSKAMKGLAPKTQVEVARMAVEHGFSAHRTEQEVQERKRRAELEAQYGRERQEKLEARRESVDAAIATAIKKGAPLDATVIVESGYYGDSQDAAWLIGRLKAAGFENARKASTWNETAARPGGCDCTAWKAKLTESYSYASGRNATTHGASITKACVDTKHQAAKESASEAKRREKEAVEHRVREHVRRTASGWAVPEGRAIAVDRILAEAALWGLLGYRIPTWAEEHGGSKKSPFAAIHALTDEQLAAELSKEIAGAFRDKAGYHVDWQTLADEIDAERAS